MQKVKTVRGMLEPGKATKCAAHYRKECTENDARKGLLVYTTATTRGKVPADTCPK